MLYYNSDFTCKLGFNHHLKCIVYTLLYLAVPGLQFTKKQSSKPNSNAVLKAAVTLSFQYPNIHTGVFIFKRLLLQIQDCCIAAEVESVRSEVFIFFNLKVVLFSSRAGQFYDWKILYCLKKKKKIWQWFWIVPPPPPLPYGYLLVCMRYVSSQAEGLIRLPFITKQICVTKHLVIWLFNLTEVEVGSTIVISCG